MPRSTDIIVTLRLKLSPLDRQTLRDLLKTDGEGMIRTYVTTTLLTGLIRIAAKPLFGRVCIDSVEVRKG